MTDKQLNEYITQLLGWTRQARIESHGLWASSFDVAMAFWDDRHPGTRPPAFSRLPQPPPCFEGELPPIYEGDLK